MWPPRPSLEPRVTIAAAFQRFQAVILASSASSPGNAGSAEVGMVLTYSVSRRDGRAVPSVRAVCSRARRIR